MIPVECEKFPGFYEIPDYPNYALSKDGLVVNKTSGEIFRGFTSKRGYWIFQLRKNNKSKKIPRHRLLAAVFKHPGVDISSLDVNHIDGIKGNDSLDNLEWVTRRENCEHAGKLGLSDKCLPMSYRCVATRVVFKVASIAACAEAVGLGINQIRTRLKAGEEKVFPEGNQYRLGHGDHPWMEPKLPKHIDGRARRVIVKLVKRDVVFEFEKLKEAAKFLGVSLPYLSIKINDNDQPLLRGAALIRWLDEFTEWRSVNPSEITTLDNRNRRIISIDDNDISEIHQTLQDCADKIGMPRWKLYEGMSRHGIVVYGNYRIYYETNSEEGPLDE